LVVFHPNYAFFFILNYLSMHDIGLNPLKNARPCAELKKWRERNRGSEGGGFHPCSIWFLGIIVAIGGHYMSWDSGLNKGFGAFLLATCLIGIAYACLIFCISETLSALPVAGGSFFIVRCTFGLFIGFLVGFTQAFEFIVGVSQMVLAFVSLLCWSLEIKEPFVSPILCACVYVIGSFIQIKGGLLFWRFNSFIGTVSLFGLVLFSCASFRAVDFTRSVVEAGPFFVDNITGFFRVLPLAAWFYWGVEAMALSHNITGETMPRACIPKGSVYCVSTLLSTSLVVLFINFSLPSGLKKTGAQENSLDVGFLLLGLSPQASIFLSLPAIFAAGYGCIFAYGQLIYLLASSGLLPKLFLWKSKSKAPVAAITAGSIVSYAICLTANFYPAFGRNLFNLRIIPAFIGYCCQCIGYVYLKRKFPKLKRHFTSPFGSVGAVFSFLVFAFGAVSAIGFQQDRQIPLIINLMLVFFAAIYYYCIARFRETLSPEEQKVLHTSKLFEQGIQGAVQRRKERELKWHLASEAKRRALYAHRNCSPRKELDTNPLKLTRASSSGVANFSSALSPSLLKRKTSDFKIYPVNDDSDVSHNADDFKYEESDQSEDLIN